MKKLLYLLLLTPIIYLVSCSSGKGNLTPEQLPIEETIVGVTWQLLNVGGGWFRLNDDYTYSTKFLLCDTFAVEGVWSLDGDVLENRYIIGAVEYVERSTIIEYSDSLLKFQVDTTPTTDAYVWFEACEPEPIRGCMDSTFLNFNPNAQCPDTCTNDPVYGCMDANALNYDATANIDDGSCCYVGGCMDATALNYNASACQDDGSCIAVVNGCTDSIGSVNYNPLANTDDGTCIPYVYGCTDSTATNYNASATTDDGSCTYPIAIGNTNLGIGNTNLAIGDTHQGGIIFWLDGNGGGLVAAPTDQSTSAEWGCYGTPISGTPTSGYNGQAIGTGNQNTIGLVAGCTTPGTAADICANLTLGGYSDWFLPSKYELEEMFLKLHLQGLGGFADDFYWSSSERGYYIAWSMDFYNSLWPTVGKNGNYVRTRAVRAF